MLVKFGALLFFTTLCLAHGHTTANGQNTREQEIEVTTEKFATLPPINETEKLYFDVDGIVDDILKSSKKNIVYKINDVLNSFYDNHTAFIHRCASTQMTQVVEANQEKRIDKMKSYVDYFFLYKQIYMELLNGYKNMVMEALGKLIKQEIRYNYLYGKQDKRLTYEEYIAKDEQLDQKLIFVNKAFRSSIINHVINVEVAMFQDMFNNHRVIFKDEEKLLKM